MHGEEPEWDTRHRDPGLLMGWGKRANASTATTEIGQLDLGALLFALSGVAVAHDVEGRVPSGLFELPEQAPGMGTYLLEEPLTPANGATISEQERSDRVEQLKQLGYLDEMGDEMLDKQRSGGSQRAGSGPGQ